uniref:Ubiquitin-conjugating enzyme E2-17 kDa isoform X1 n=1 Tax=Rhizophora mucronata TaxID=61149 RepID=A0A2P2L8G0_RHIMU
MHLGGFERIIRWEMDGHKEDPTSIWTIIWTNDGSLPVKHILSHRTCTA